MPADAVTSHCRRGHELSPENLYRYGETRICRQCRREGKRRRRKGYCSLGHRYDAADTPTDERTGWWRCRICTEARKSRPRRRRGRTRQRSERLSVPDRFNGKKTHCVRGHAYTPANTAIRQGKRNCRTCERDRSRRSTCPHGHPYINADGNTDFDLAGRRRCRTCFLDRQAATRCRNGHLWAENTRIAPTGKRTCAQCLRDSQRRQDLRRLPHPGEAWKADAACRPGTGVNPDLFFATDDRGSKCKQAERICGECPVSAECLAYARASGEQYGIWGGVKRTRRLPQRKKAS